MDSYKIGVDFFEWLEHASVAQGIRPRLVAKTLAVAIRIFTIDNIFYREGFISDLLSKFPILASGDT